MITQEQIEAKGFKFFRGREDTDGRGIDEYLALGTRKEGFDNEYTIPLILSYTRSGSARRVGDLIINAYYNNPLIFGKRYVLYDEALTQVDLDQAMISLDFTITEIDLTRIKADYP